MSEPPQHHGLIFQWLAREGNGLRLFAGGVATLLAFGGFLLLFQVVYPTARQRPLAVQRVLLLDPASPAVRPVLDAVNDRDFLLMRSARDESKTAVGPPLAFTPSFKGFELQPKDLLESRATSTLLPRVFQPDHPPLPPVPATASMPVPKSAIPHVLQATVVDGLKQRPITHAVTFKDDALGDIVGTVYRIAVAPSGRVTLVIPLSDPAGRFDAFQQVRTGLTELRFQASPTQAIEWGTLTLKWLATKP